MSDLLDNLDERKRKLEESNRRHEEAAEKAKEIAYLQRKQDSLQDQIGSYLSEAKPKAGTIKRLTAGLGALSPVDAIYKANEAASKQSDAFSYNATLAKTLATSYAKSIRDNIMTAATNKDYTFGHKTYKDIITKQMGMKDGTMATVLGVTGDIGTDPINFLGGMAFKGVSKLGSVIGKEMTSIASKSSLIEKGIQSVKAKFNLFAEIEKFSDPQTVAKFKEAFSEAAESKNFNMLRRMGFDVADFKGTGTKAVGNAPTNYSLRNSKGQFVNKRDYQTFQGVLEEAFGAQKAAGPFGKALDVTSGVFKRLMSWSPKFQTRNMIGAVTQGLMEGAGPKEYFQATKMVLNKGKNNPAEWAELVKQGLTKSTGMFEQELSRIPAKVANFGESVNRIALYLAEKNSGKSLITSVEKTRDVFYRYSKAYMTSFEKNVMSRIDPFWAFDKGQMKYWPGGLGRNAAKYNALGDIKNATEPEETKKYPFLTPDYWKDMFSVDKIGNIGFQLEDFLKNITGDTKNLWGRLQPLLKGTFELVTDWKVFQGKALSKDKAAGQYANVPEPLRKLLGYDAASNTVNPYAKWATELMAGPIMDPIKNLFDPKKGILSVFTSIRDYDLGVAKTSAQTDMNRKQDMQGGFWQNILNRYSLGPAEAAAGTTTSKISSTVTPIILDAVSQWNQDYIKSKIKDMNISTDVYGKQYIANGGNEQSMIQNAAITSLNNIMKSYMTAGPIFAENQAKANATELQIIDLRENYLKSLGIDLSEERKIIKQRQDFERQRSTKEPGYYSPTDFEKWRKPLPGLPGAQNWIKAQQEKVEFTSKTAEMRRAAEDTSPESIKRTLAIEKYAATQAYITQWGGISLEEYMKRMAAAQDKAEYGFDKLETKFNKAQASIFKNMADASVDAFAKINYERQAAELNYYGSEEYRNALAFKNSKDKQMAIMGAQQIEDWKATNNAKYDKLRSEEFAKRAKADLENVKKFAKGEAENIIATIKDVYERGGMTIKDYFGQQYKAEVDAQTKIAMQSITQIIALLQERQGASSVSAKNLPQSSAASPSQSIMSDFKLSADPDSEKTPHPMLIAHMTNRVNEAKAKAKNIEEFLKAIEDMELTAMGIAFEFNAKDGAIIPVNTANDNKMIKDLNKLFNDLKDGKLSPKEQVDAITNFVNELKKVTEGLNYEAFTNALTEFAAVAQNIAQKGINQISDIRKAELQLQKANNELQDELAKLRLETAQNAPASLPYYYVSKLFGKENPQMSKEKFGRNTSPFEQMSGNQDDEVLRLKLKQYDNETAGKIDSYAKQTKLTGINLEQEPGDDAQTYFNKLKENIDAYETYREQMTVQGQAKIDAIKDMSVERDKQRNLLIVEHDRQVMEKKLSFASQTAGMIKNIGEQLYEASGRQSKEAFYVMKAAALAEAMINGALAVSKAWGQGGYYGAAMAAVTAAAVAVQIGLIAGSAIQGPGKAQGGMIEGGSGQKDDVAIMAMGGEYVVKKSSVRKYGTSFLEALNKGLIPINDINFSIPANNYPDSRTRHFAEGGAVASNTIPQAQSHDQAENIQIVNVIDPQLLDKYLASNRGQKTLVNVLAANKYELQYMMR